MDLILVLGLLVGLIILGYEVLRCGADSGDGLDYREWAWRAEAPRHAPYWD